MGGGYDDSLLQDATSVGGGLFSSSLDLGFKGRAFRDLSGSLAGQVSCLSQPNAPSQDLIDLGGQGRLAWRFFDLLSPLIEGSASQSSAPRPSSLDSTELGYGAGLRVDLFGWGCLELLSVGGARNYPRTDQDYDQSGAVSRLDLDLSPTLQVQMQAQSLNRRFSESYLYTSTSASVGADLRRDRVTELECSLQWSQDGLGTQAFGRSGVLSSNGDSIDYGPHQNQYNNTYIPLGPGAFLNDNTWQRDYYSQHSQGGGLRVWGQWGGFGAKALAAVDDIHFDARMAKGADDKFLAGSPLLEQRIIQGGLTLSYLWALGPLNLELDATWNTWSSASNDSLYSYRRNLSTLDAALLF